MTDIKQIPVKNILLGESSRSIAAGTAPLFPEDGPTKPQ